MAPTRDIWCNISEAVQHLAAEKQEKKFLWVLAVRLYACG